MNALSRLVPPDMDARLECSVALRIPEHCQSWLLDYLRYGIQPGGFLLAVLSNDLKDACARADETNQRALYDYIYVLYNDAPSDAWGSPAHVTAWIARGIAARENAEPAEAQP